MNQPCEYPRCLAHPQGCPHIQACLKAGHVRIDIHAEGCPICAAHKSPECEHQPPECPPPPAKPGRPGRPQGVDTGRLNDPTPLTKGDLNKPNIPGSWVGPRKDMCLPFLFMRANPGDLGKRPVAGPFWESPDIFILPGVSPAFAPPVPPKLGDTALANQPNTIYAHVWNFGNSGASEVIVEFYWCDPSLGVNNASVHLISQEEIALGAKGSGNSHKVVKCSEPWTPTFLNGGHECLLVRVWDNPSDLPGEPKLDASINRHVGQRNIHVIASPGAPMLIAAHLLNLAPAPLAAQGQPLFLKVGPLYGAPAEVNVERIAPHIMPWLQLHTGERGKFPAQATPTGTPALSGPVSVGGGYPVGGLGTRQTVTGDDQQVAFTTSDAMPDKGEAHVYRVSASQDGVVFGGYTVVVLGA
jgi:hypothetical protein